MSALKCRSCGAELVERANPTAIDAWCGTWFDHPPVAPGDCTRRDTVLIESEALKQQNAELLAEHESRLEGLA